ncbi:adenylate kinase, partial [Pseudomonas sp. FW306-1C-G01A]
MSQKIIAVVGVSGVGKSTFLKKLQSKVEFQLLQASDVIRQQIQNKENQHLNAEVLRHANIDENQR